MGPGMVVGESTRGRGDAKVARGSYDHRSPLPPPWNCPFGERAPKALRDCCPYSASCREVAFSETQEVRSAQGPWLLLECRKRSYCNKRMRTRTSKIMSRAAITTLPIWNALRRSYLKLLLFLLRPIGSLSLLLRGRRGLLLLKASFVNTLGVGVWWQAGIL